VIARARRAQTQRTDRRRPVAAGSVATAYRPARRIVAFRPVLAGVVLAVLLVTLTGCGPDDASLQRARLCLAHGGSYTEHYSEGWACTR